MREFLTHFFAAAAPGLTLLLIAWFATRPRRYKPRPLTPEETETLRILNRRPMIMIKRMRHCWNCGDELGELSEFEHDANDVCGKPECCRAAQDAAREERARAHEQLDRDHGWGEW